jgi:hypothetical protein
MNCIPTSGAPGLQSIPSNLDPLGRASLGLIAICSLLLAGSCSATDAPEETLSTVYSLAYHVVPLPGQNRMQVELTLGQSRPLLLEMRMRAAADYFSEFAGDGQISVQDGKVVWVPPAQGGVLSWSVKPNRLKSGNRYDAYMSDTWAVLRASDIIPPAATRTVRHATSNTSLSFGLPAGWSSATQYAGRNHRYRIDNPARRFDRPTGWILLGQIGTRTEEIAGVKVKIAAPKMHAVRRMDMLALLAWTLPDATRLFSDFPSRLTIISANEPMWRGGLSAPSSLFIHASLPLLSENATSTLLHEIVHIGMRASAGDGADWIIEGMAEFYGLQLLLRSSTITEKRYRHALSQLKAWGDDVPTLCNERSSGPITARATILMQDLDMEIRKSTDQEHNLDDVMNVLSHQDQKITIDDLVRAVAGFMPTDSTVLAAAALDNCTS